MEEHLGFSMEQKAILEKRSNYSMWQYALVRNVLNDSFADVLRLENLCFAKQQASPIRFQKFVVLTARPPKTVSNPYLINFFLT